MNHFKVMSSPREIYRNMLEDISSAKKSIFLETYIYGNDEIGNKFRKALTRKARQGVKVLLLIDSWGAEVDNLYFKELIDSGGKVEFFKEISYVIRFFSRNHERNHRKLLIIDQEITYLGSININSKDWRELVIRLEGEITSHFAESFHKSWNLSGKFSKKKIKSWIHKEFEIIHDIPADSYKLTEDRYTKLIKNSKKEILIETPYFIPPIRLRRALAKAVRRGVDVNLLLPKSSDLIFFDILRNRYLGTLHRAGVKIYYYTPKILHSKLLLVDEKFFLLGSSNLDYRSYLHDHEINLIGADRKMISSLREFYENGLKHSKPFIYEEWRNRYSLIKIIEMFLAFIERYL